MREFGCLLLFFRIGILGIPLIAIISTLIWGRDTINTWQTWFLICSIPFLIYGMFQK